MPDMFILVTVDCDSQESTAATDAARSAAVRMAAEMVLEHLQTAHMAHPCTHDPVVRGVAVVIADPDGDGPSDPLFRMSADARDVLMRHWPAAAPGNADEALMARCARAALAAGPRAPGVTGKDFGGDASTAPSDRA
jgi:hypothetical protein